jgi:5-methylcytosine-specific restriction protein A
VTAECFGACFMEPGTLGRKVSRDTLSRKCPAAVAWSPQVADFTVTCCRDTVSRLVSRAKRDGHHPPLGGVCPAGVPAPRTRMSSEATMPTAAPTLCPRCLRPQPCDRHVRQPWQRTGPTPARKRGRPWRRLRAQVLVEEPLCRVCEKRPSEEVDHVDHQGPTVRGNLQGICGVCHKAKTQREAGRARGDTAALTEVVLVTGPPAFDRGGNDTRETQPRAGGGLIPWNLCDGHRIGAHARINPFPRAHRIPETP